MRASGEAGWLPWEGSLGVNEARMLRFFLLGLVLVSLMQDHYGCDDKEHLNRVPRQLTICASEPRPQLSIPLRLGFVTCQ